MLVLPPSLRKLVEELTKLPSIGEKSASRLANYLVSQKPQLARTLAEALVDASTNIKLCQNCFFLCEGETCSICKNTSRDPAVLCIVEKPMDVMAIERVGEFRGLYHVLHGVWAPLRGMGPEDMKLAELESRVHEQSVGELILATSSTVEGDATAAYIAKIFGEQGLKVSRLAQGIPKGGELEYADDVTLSRALAGRFNI